MLNDDQKTFSAHRMTLDVYNATGRVMDEHLRTCYPHSTVADRWSQETHCNR